MSKLIEQASLALEQTGSTSNIFTQELNENSGKSLALAKEIAKSHKNMKADVNRGNVHIYHKGDSEAIDRLVLSHTGKDKEGNDRFHLHRIRSAGEDEGYRNLTADEVKVHAKKHIIGEEVLEEETKPSLAHLAADHYHHVGTGSDYNDGATEKEKRQGRKDAKETLKTVEKHYGKDTAKDVAHHTNYAFAHDNASGPGGGAGTHKKFAEKHLGGVDSAQHKEYIARLHHHGYETGDGIHTND